MSHLNDLIRILADEKRLYTELTNLAHDKQKTIINNEIEQLTEHLKKEQELIDEIESMERERRNAVIGLCVDLNISEKELSFSKLRQYLDEASKVKLDQFKTSLMGILEELHETNETNRMLIEEALRINDFTLRALTQATTPASPTYTKSGESQQKGPQHLFDKKA